MPSHGALKESALAEAPSKTKLPKVLHEMTLSAPKNGGAIAQHTFTHYEHKPEVHAFAANEGPKLAAHIEQHLGIKMPGMAKANRAEMEEPEADKGTDE
jgi:hypothetical protein